MNYDEALGFLYGLRQFGCRPGLDTTRTLAARLGGPERRLRFIHVAGTNGKGSVCAMLENVYRATGLRVGLYTSPHLVRFGERIQVNRRLIPEAEIVRRVAELGAAIRDEPAERRPTFFEAVTVMALCHFAEEQCDLVVWETGLGGRLDATNIVTPVASVITNIAFDHEQWLGDTLAKIAAEKAGIIKPRVPVITGVGTPEALEVIAATARRQDAPLTVVAADPTSEAWGLDPPPRLGLLGEHQWANAALAVATVRLLRETWPVSEAALRRGLETVSWPGRLQVVRRGEQTLLLDGAHNPAGAVALRAALARHFGERAPTLILGVLADKAWSAVCEVLAPVARRILLVPVQSQRTARPEDLWPVVRVANATAEVLTCSSLAEALERAARDEFIVVTGSLYLVGEVIEMLGLGEGMAPGERGLNEWGAPRVAT
ncbi:MAG TPA: folylpolyglutamate synthase/dihydrofolate synthase family protein [Methylomirabilota bacterium]|nr:folylpolyglutamate synthase/dihydrofolate synthase family protein [Methylomirabilota bacterium]